MSKTTTEIAKIVAEHVAQRHLSFSKDLLRMAQTQLEHCINATPTGERRNALTQLNIDMFNLLTQLNSLPPQ